MGCINISKELCASIESCTEPVRGHSQKTVQNVPVYDDKGRITYFETYINGRLVNKIGEIK